MLAQVLVRLTICMARNDKVPKSVVIQTVGQTHFYVYFDFNDLMIILMVRQDLTFFSVCAY